MQCNSEVLEAPHAVAVHLFKNWWGGFGGSSAQSDPEDSGTGPYSHGIGPYGTGPYGMRLGSSFISSEENVEWLRSPSCEMNVIFYLFPVSSENWCRDASFSCSSRTCVTGRSPSRSFGRGF